MIVCVVLINLAAWMIQASQLMVRQDVQNERISATLKKVNRILSVLDDSHVSTQVNAHSLHKESFKENHNRNAGQSQPLQHYIKALMKPQKKESAKNLNKFRSQSTCLQPKKSQPSISPSRSIKSRNSSKEIIPSRLQRVMALKVEKPQSRSIVKDLLLQSQYKPKKKWPPLFQQLQEQSKKTRCLTSHFKRLNYQIERDSKNSLQKMKKTQQLKDHLQREFQRQRQIQYKQKLKEQTRRSKQLDRDDKKQFYRSMRQNKKNQNRVYKQSPQGKGKTSVQKAREELKASACRRIKLQDDINTTLQKILGRVV